MLDDIEFEKEERESANADDVFDGIDPEGYQFRSSSLSWQDDMESPEKPNKYMRRMEREIFFKQLDHKQDREVHNVLKNLVLKNIYRGYYDIAEERQVRKADPTMRAVVETSEALEGAETLHNKGLHPSLILFGKDLFESQIQRCLRHLHGKNIEKENKSSMHV